MECSYAYLLISAMWPHRQTSRSRTCGRSVRIDTGESSYALTISMRLFAAKLLLNRRGHLMRVATRSIRFLCTGKGCGKAQSQLGNRLYCPGIPPGALSLTSVSDFMFEAVLPDGSPVSRILRLSCKETPVSRDLRFSSHC